MNVLFTAFVYDEFNVFWTGKVFNCIYNGIGSVKHCSVVGPVKFFLTSLPFKLE